MNRWGSEFKSNRADIVRGPLQSSMATATARCVVCLQRRAKQHLELERTARDGYENYGGPWLAQPCKPNGGARGAAAAAAVIALATDCARV